MNFSVEQQFVLCCAKSNWTISAKSELQEFLRRPLNWEKAMQIAVDAGIATLIYHALSNIMACDVVPKQAIEKLQRIYHDNGMRNLLLYQEIRKIIQSAGEKGIPVILLKGAALAHSVYSDIACRSMGDIDLLVHQKHLEMMDSIMRQFGYESENYDMSAEKKSHHLPTYVQHPYQVEIHWNLLPPRDRVNLPLSAIWDRARRLEIEDVPALMLAPEDSLIHLCLHLSVHHQFQLRPLKNLCDIAETIRHYSHDINWQRMRKWASKLKIGVYLASTLTLAKRILDIPLDEDILKGFYPQPFDDELMECIVTEMWTNPETSSPAPLDIAIISAQKNLLARFKKVMRCIFPARQRLSQRFNIAPHSPLIYLYYPIYLVDRMKRRGTFLFRLIFRDKSALASMASKQRQEKIRHWFESMRG